MHASKLKASFLKGLIIFFLHFILCIIRYVEYILILITSVPAEAGGPFIQVKTMLKLCLRA